MLTIIQTMTHKNKTYHVAETETGKILFSHFGGAYTKYRNLSNQDVLWTVKPTEEFEWLFQQVPIRTITSKRMKNMKVIHKFTASETRYHVLEKPLSDGYYYVADHTHMRLFPEDKYPNVTYIYQTFRKDALRDFDHLVLRRTFEEETARFNGDHSASPYVMAVILEEVSQLAASQEETDETQISLF